MKVVASLKVKDKKIQKQVRRKGRRYIISKNPRDKKRQG